MEIKFSKFSKKTKQNKTKKNKQTKSNNKKTKNKQTINWNKYQLKATIEMQHRYLDYLIDSSFQGENNLVVLSFEYNTVRTGHTRYVVSKVEIKN